MISSLNFLSFLFFFFFFNDTATTEIYTLSLHDALPIHRLELLPLQCADIIGGRRREIERRESIANRVECPDGGPVGVLVVADDEIVGQPIERPGLAGHRNDVLVHGRAPWLMVDFISCPDTLSIHCCYYETIVSYCQHMITLCVTVRIWGRRTRLMKLSEAPSPI